MIRFLAAAGALVLIAGCAKIEEVASGLTGDGTRAAEAETAPAPAPAEPDVRVVKSVDGSFEGEIIGAPAPGSRFARVRIGMARKEVEDLIGAPDDSDSHITGKQFIPFFFGGDTHRAEAFYKGEGILTYSPSHFAGTPNVLVRIIADPTERGYAH